MEAYTDEEEEIIADTIFTVSVVHECFALYEALRKERQVWVRDYFLDRNTSGYYAASFQKLCNDPQQFKIATRMTVPLFNALFNLLKERLEKTSNREPIPAKCRLLLTLIYLAHGATRQHLSLMFKMSVSSVRMITLETCNFIWDALSSIYISTPNITEWKKIAEDFKNMWNLPNCVGAIDGKHVSITCPPKSGSNFYNYKGVYSIVLLAICDANYTFTAVDVGAYGSQSDGGILAHSEFGKRLFSNDLDFPPESTLPDSATSFPHYIVGDAAFPLRTNLMRPYPGLLLDEQRDNFNRRLSRARRVIENAFGILAARWRIYHRTMNMFPESAEVIVNATVVLHNFLKLSDNSYSPPDYVDKIDSNGTVIREGLWRQVTIPLRRIRSCSSNNANKSAFQLRNSLKEYLFQHKLN